MCAGAIYSGEKNQGERGCPSRPTIKLSCMQRSQEALLRGAVILSTVKSRTNRNSGVIGFCPNSTRRARPDFRWVRASRSGPAWSGPLRVRVVEFGTYTFLCRLRLAVANLQGGTKTGPHTHDHSSVKSILTDWKIPG